MTAVDFSNCSRRKLYSMLRSFQKIPENQLEDNTVKSFTKQEVEEIEFQLWHLEERYRKLPRKDEVMEAKISELKRLLVRN